MSVRPSVTFSMPLPRALVSQFLCLAISLSQVATLGADCKAVADSKYNIAELLESYVVDDDAKAGKQRARALYQECEQVYFEMCRYEHLHTSDIQCVRVVLMSLCLSLSLSLSLTHTLSLARARALSLCAHVARACV